MLSQSQVEMSVKSSSRKRRSFRAASFPPGFEQSSSPILRSPAAWLRQWGLQQLNRIRLSIVRSATSLSKDVEETRVGFDAAIVIGEM